MIDLLILFFGIFQIKHFVLKTSDQFFELGRKPRSTSELNHIEQN